MSDWQQPPQEPSSSYAVPIAMPAQPPAQTPPKGRGWGVLKILVIGLLVVALLTSGLLNLGLLVGRLGGSRTSRGGSLEEVVVQGSGRNKVAIVSISGILIDDGNPFGAGGFSFMVKQLEQAQNDPSVRAVVLEVDSPGGGVTASDDLAHQVEALGMTKTVVVSMGSIAASGGYYVSAPADRIYARPTSITGSIGVIYTSLNMKELMDKIGIRPNVVKSGHLKGFGSMFRDMTPQEREMIEGIINDAFERFKGVVRKGRGMTEEEVDAIATGGVFTARQALDLELIDEIGYLDDAIEEAMSLAELRSAKVIRYKESLSLMRLLMARSGNGTGKVELELKAPGTGWPRAGLYYIWEAALAEADRSY